MEFIITDANVALLVVLYFLGKYLQQTFLKCAVGCEKPFSPFYTYWNYKTWDKAYAKGNNDAVKQMKAISDDFKAVAAELKVQANNVVRDAQKLQLVKEELDKRAEAACNEH